MNHFENEREKEIPVNRFHDVKRPTHFFSFLGENLHEQRVHEFKMCQNSPQRKIYIEQQK